MEPIEGFNEGEVFSVELLEKVFIRKQAVRKAIEKVAGHGEDCRCPVRMNQFTKNELLKEMGL